MTHSNQARSSGVAQFYNVRRQAYLVLLLFVVAVGMPVIGVPVLRNRLQSRVQELREALAGGVHKAVTQNVGENTSPFPSEYEHTFVPPIRDRVQPFQGYVPNQVDVPVIPAAPSPAPARHLNIPIPKTGEELVASAESEPEQGKEAGAAQGPAAVQYNTGDVETEAYGLLKESSTTISGLIAGSDPLLKFESWGAARMGDDLYWVRLTFTKSPDATSEVYIWEVNLRTRKINPLSFNARALPQP